MYWWIKWITGSSGSEQFDPCVLRRMTSRIAIRPIAATDEKAFISAIRASSALHGGWVRPPQNGRAFKQYLRRFDQSTHYAFVVCLTDPSELVGTITVTNVVLGPFCSGYLSYFAFAGYEGRGLMKQGLKAVIRTAFTDLGLHRLEANIQPENKASIGLVRSCGFKKEGYSPKYLKIGGRWRDHERWAIVKH